MSAPPKNGLEKAVRAVIIVAFLPVYVLGRGCFGTFMDDLLDKIDRR